MRINHNIPSLNTYRQLSANGAQSSKSLEKLSSGLRINKAGDDAAGLAISEKMRAQIRGLDQASRNSQDAISLIQTAEGALAETHSILQRMRELATQSANDANVDADRDEIQKEINQLTSEINRIGNTTEFNTRTLLNGKVNMSTGITSALKGGSVSGGVTIRDEATKATATGGALGGTVSISAESGVTVTGNADVSGGVTVEKTAAALTATASGAQVSVSSRDDYTATGTRDMKAATAPVLKTKAADLTSTFAPANTLEINGETVTLTNVGALGSGGGGDPHTIEEIATALQLDLNFEFDGTKNNGVRFTVGVDGDKLTITSSEKYATAEIEITANETSNKLGLTATDSDDITVTGGIHVSRTDATAVGSNVAAEAFEIFDQDYKAVTTGEEFDDGLGGAFAVVEVGNNEIDIKLNGDPAVTIFIDAKDYDGDPGNTLQDFLDDFNAKLDDEFDSGTIKAVLNAENKIELRTSAANSSIEITGGGLFTTHLGNSATARSITANNRLTVEANGLEKTVTLNTGIYTGDDVNTAASRTFAAGTTTFTITADGDQGRDANAVSFQFAGGDDFGVTWDTTNNKVLITLDDDVADSANNASAAIQTAIQNLGTVELSDGSTLDLSSWEFAAVDDGAWQTASSTFTKGATSLRGGTTARDDAFQSRFDLAFGADVVDTAWAVAGDGGAITLTESADEDRSTLNIISGSAATVLGLDDATVTQGTGNELTLTLDGDTETVYLGEDSYDTAEEFAAELQEKIQARGGEFANVTVAVEDGRMVFSSNDSSKELSIDATNANSAVKYLLADPAADEFGETAVTPEAHTMEVTINGFAPRTISLEGGASTAAALTGAKNATLGADVDYEDSDPLALNGVEIALTEVGKLKDSGPDIEIGQLVQRLQADIDAVFNGTAHGGQTFTVGNDGNKLTITSTLQGTEAAVEITAGAAADKLGLTDGDDPDTDNNAEHGTGLNGANSGYDLSVGSDRDAFLTMLRPKLDEAFGAGNITAGFNSDNKLVLTNVLEGADSTVSVASGTVAGALGLGGRSAQGTDNSSLTLTYDTGSHDETATVSLEERAYTAAEFATALQTEIQGLGTVNGVDFSQVSVSVNDDGNIAFTTTGVHDKLTIDAGGALTLLATDASGFDEQNIGAGNTQLTVTVNGVEKTITLDDGTYDMATQSEALLDNINAKLDTKFGVGNVVADIVDNKLVLENQLEGSRSTIGVSTTSSAASQLGMNDSAAVSIKQGLNANNEATISINGIDADISLDAGSYDAEQLAEALQTQIRTTEGLENARVSYTDGAFSVSAGTAGAGAVEITGEDLAKALGLTQVQGAVSTAGTDSVEQGLRFQVGANTNQSITVDIDDMRSQALKVSSDTSEGTVTSKDGKATARYVKLVNVTDGTNNTNEEYALDVSTHENATAAISIINDAIQTVSAERSKLGAFQNRLEHTITNLGTSAENLAAAESRIRDVDMAREMMEFSKNNILTQAAQAMLAQANQQPQGVLQLLR